MVVGIAAQSRVVSAGFGSYGAAMSVYHHFLARGRDVVYPKDMAMVVGLETRDAKSSNAAKQSAQ
jgi:tRNA A58 N-methylase Trm61